MISNERPSPPAQGSRGNPGPGANEETLRSEKIQIERKTFVFSLKENPRGRFLRITEEVSGHYDTIIIPAPGLGDFKRVFDDMVRLSEGTPSKSP